MSSRFHAAGITRPRVTRARSIWISPVGSANSRITKNVSDVSEFKSTEYRPSDQPSVSSTTLRCRVSSCFKRDRETERKGAWHRCKRVDGEEL